MIDFVVPPIFYLGAYAFAILVFALFGGLCAKKYKWQYAITKVAAVALSAFLSIAVLKSFTPAVGKMIVDLAESFIEDSEIADILAYDGVVEWTSQIIGVIISFALFIPLFVIIKAFVNLFFRIIAKAIFRSAAKRREAKEELSTVCECMAEAPADSTEPTETVGPAEIQEGETLAEPLPEQTEENIAVKDEALSSEPVAPVKKKKVNPLIAEKGRGWSFLCGAVSGFLVFIVLSAPATCFLSDVGGIASALLYSLDEEDIAENIESATRNPGSDIVSVCGGRLIYDSLGSFTLSGEKVVL